MNDEIKGMLQAIREGQQVTNARLESMEKELKEIKQDVKYLEGDMTEVKEHLARLERKQDNMAETLAFVTQDVYMMQKKAGGEK